MASSSLQKSTRTILNRWAKEGFYIYIRPLTSKYINSRSEHKVYWSVAVELRTTPPGQWRGEGYNLDDVIAELATRVPRGRKEHRAKNAGWLAPESVLAEEVEQMKSERPRKRSQVSMCGEHDKSLEEGCYACTKLKRKAARQKKKSSARQR